jgi:FkbM family methyltransferase
MRELIKKNIKDTGAEPYVRWLFKRSRGIRMPFDLVKNEIYDRQAAEVIERVLRHNSNAIDVGCHKGQFLKLFLKHAPKGHHYAFEPIPHLAKVLQAEFPSVEVYNYALSNKPGEAVFYVIPDAPALSGLNARTFVAPDKPRQEIVVSTERLDTMIPQEVRIDLIKIDVEGAEGLVIEGAIDTIKRNKPYIILEHGGSSSMAFGVSSGDIYDLLVEQCGLRLSLLKNWLYRGSSLSKREFMAGGNWYFLAHRAD